MRRFDMAESVLVHYLSVTPNDSRIWIELAVIRMTRNQTDRALDAIEKAIEKGGDSTRALLLKDTRFRPFYNNPRFRTLVPPQAAPKPMQFNKLF